MQKERQPVPWSCATMLAEIRIVKIAVSRLFLNWSTPKNGENDVFESSPLNIRKKKAIQKVVQFSGVT